MGPNGLPSFGFLQAAENIRCWPLTSAFHPKLTLALPLMS